MGNQRSSQCLIAQRDRNVRKQFANYEIVGGDTLVDDFGRHLAAQLLYSPRLGQAAPEGDLFVELTTAGHEVRFGDSSIFGRRTHALEPNLGGGNRSLGIRIVRPLSHVRRLVEK